MGQKNIFRQTKFIQFRLSGHGGQLWRQTFDDIGAQVVLPEYQSPTLNDQRRGQDAAPGQVIAQALAQGLRKAGAVDLQGLALLRRRGPELTVFEFVPERWVYMAQRRGNVAQQHHIAVGYGGGGHLEPPVALLQHGQLIPGSGRRGQGHGIGSHKITGSGGPLILSASGQRNLGGAHLWRTQLALDLRRRTAVIALAVLPDGLRHTALSPGLKRRGPACAKQGQSKKSKHEQRTTATAARLEFAPACPD